MTVDPASVKHERKKVYRFAKGVRNETISLKKAEDCIFSWFAHAMTGNSIRLVRRMNDYFNETRRA